MAILAAAIPAIIWMNGQKGAPPAGAPTVANSDSNRAASNLPRLVRPEKRSSLPAASDETTSSQKPDSAESDDATSASEIVGNAPAGAADHAEEALSQPAQTTVGESAIPVDNQEAVTFGGSGCPVVVVGKGVWDIEKKTIRATLEGSYDKGSMRALSADGRYFAATERAAHSNDNPVHVWDTASGKICLKIPDNSSQKIQLLELAGDRVFLGRQSSDRMAIWNVPQAREEQTITLPGRKVDPANTAIAHNGLYVAAVDEDKLVVIKIETGQTMVTMRAPKQMATRRMPELPPGMVRVDRGGWIVDQDEGGTANDSECRAVYSSLQALEFSPDSRELAAVASHPKPRVICWNYQGRRILDAPLHTERAVSGQNTITWFPGGKAWLLGGDVFDREAGKVVLSVRKSSSDGVRVHVRDDDHLVGAFPHSPGQLQVVEIPWEGIRKSLGELKDDAPALLSPAQPVSIVFELGALRGNQSTTVSILGDSLKARLARDGLKVEPGQTTYFRVRFSEEAGDSVAIFERQSPFDWRGRDTGRRVREAEGNLVVELIVPGSTEPVWRDTLSADSDNVYHGDISEMLVRDSMVQNLADRMNDLSFPYFIPKSEDLLALPVVMQ